MADATAALRATAAGDASPETDAASGSQQQVSLADLPANVLANVLHRAGPHVRQVCRAFHDHHPPLLNIAPHGLPTSGALTAALAALPPSLTCLDLRNVTKPSHGPLTDAHLATVCSSLPQLRRLLMPIHTYPWECHITAAHYASLAHLPHLHTLHAYDFNDHPPCHGSVPFHHPAIATRLRSLSLPALYAPALLNAPPGTLPCLTALCLRASSGRRWPIPAAGIAALSAAAPALRSLAFYDMSWETMVLDDDDDAEPLAALTALTSLTLPGGKGVRPHRQRPPAPLLHHVGTLTNLASLSLTLEHYGWTPAEAGWLASLVQLTHLAVCFRHLEGFAPQLMAPTYAAPWAGDAGAGAPHAPAPALVAASVARDAARLPLLCSLELGYAVGRHSGLGSAALAYGTLHSFVRHLAAATQLLRLCLTDFLLPASEAHLLTGLQQLTCLLVALPEEHCAVDGGGGDLLTEPLAATDLDLQWAATLPGLRQLALPRGITPLEPAQQGPDGTVAGPAGLLQAVGRLSHLHTLSLPHLDPGHDLGGVLERLQGRLERLDLRYLDSWYLPALGVLGGMQQLWEVDLYGRWPVERAAPHLVLPHASLRRCWLYDGGRLPHCKEARLAAVAALQQQCPLATFCFFPRPDLWCGEPWHVRGWHQQ